MVQSGFACVYVWTGAKGRRVYRRTEVGIQGFCARGVTRGGGRGISYVGALSKRPEPWLSDYDIGPAGPLGTTSRSM